MSKPMVIYHANCADGFTAAWVASLAVGADATFVPASYGNDPPDVSGRDVYIVDFSYKRPVMREILSHARRVVVLDHHKTAEMELAGLEDEFLMRPDLIAAPRDAQIPTIHFDMESSGARLAWNYFFPGQAVPWLVDYTEDRDLWLWRLPHSREISAFLGSVDRTFGNWTDFAEERVLGPRWGSFVDQGSAILRYQDQLVAAICATAREVEIAGHRVPAANTPVLISEVAGRLAEGRPFGASWYVRRDGVRQWSLRSRDGGVDVSEVARSLGGGGHRNAAGFQQEEA